MALTRLQYEIHQTAEKCSRDDPKSLSLLGRHRLRPQYLRLGPGEDP